MTATPGTGASPPGPPPAIDTELAPAKINLALHVTGRRDDGYHLLDTLVVHGGGADRVSALRSAAAEPAAAAGAVDPAAAAITLTITGPTATGLSATPDNLVLRAARLLEAEARRIGRAPFPVALGLEKHLPIASGIGGGSSDAAATLRLLDRVWGLGLGRGRLAELALPLGADVPMCVWGVPLRARGIGEAIEPLAELPAFALVLVNPGIAVSTPAVFRALASRQNPPMPPLPAHFADLGHFAGWLGATRNDLEPAAVSIAPAIAFARDRLAAEPGCLLARMSGSGATVFGLFADAGRAAEAARRVAAERPDLWVGTSGGAA